MDRLEAHGIFVGGVVMSLEAIRAEVDSDLLYQAWGVIANVSQGDWAQQTPEWQDAAKRWRDAWHETLGRDQ